jgi:catechol 2,3-dioxygenase-like lactoylglutathione lyase family enzyme
MIVKVSFKTLTGCPRVEALDYNLRGVRKTLSRISASLRRITRLKVRIKRLDHVQLCIPVGEEEKARDFYTRVLGLEEIEKPAALKSNGGLWFKVADIQLHIGVEDVQGKSKRHPAFEVEDIKGVREYLRGHDVQIKDETVVPGMDRFSFFDPFGNRIEFMEKNGS